MPVESISTTRCGPSCNVVQHSLRSLHVAVYPEPDAPSLALDGRHAGQLPNGTQLFIRGHFGVNDAEGAVRLAQPVQFVAHEEPTVLDYPDGVGDGFYVGEEVGREKHGPSLGGHLADEDLEEGATGHGIEARDGLVQDQDLWVAPERETKL